jgi:hypothetical protein
MHETNEESTHNVQENFTDTTSENPDIEITEYEHLQRDKIPRIHLEFSNVPKYVIDQILDISLRYMNNRYETDNAAEEQKYTFHPNYFKDTTAKSDFTDDVPAYERLTHDCLTAHELEKKARFQRSCWNCHDPNHEVSQCRQPIDNESIRESRLAFMEHVHEKQQQQQQNRFYSSSPSTPQKPVTIMPPSADKDSVSFVSPLRNTNTNSQMTPPSNQQQFTSPYQPAYNNWPTYQRYDPAPHDVQNQQYSQYYQQLFAYYTSPPAQSVWQPPPPTTPPPSDKKRVRKRRRTQDHDGGNITAGNDAVNV